MEKINCIPDTIKRFREMRGLSLQEIADDLGVAVSTVGRWERGESTPSAVDAYALARVLRISVSTLIEGQKAG